MPNKTKRDALQSQRRHVVVLVVLLAMLVFRVLAQLIQSIYPVEFLPSFSKWASGALPYTVLVIIQIAIIAGFIVIILQMSRAQIARSKRVGTGLYLIGTVYFTAMFFRLMIGLLFENTPQWFQFPIPSFFHLVLASFLLVLANFHLPLWNFLRRLIPEQNKP